jgi:hypothetical protein
MRMRRGAWLMALSAHLATLSIRHDGITGCMKLESVSLEYSPMA